MYTPLTASQIVCKTSSSIPSITSPLERVAIAELALQVPAGKRILEIGSLYGGTTAILAMASPTSTVYTVDDFAWYPKDWGMGPTSPERLETDLAKLGLRNVSIIKGDSREVKLEKSFALLFIDGGHSYEFVRADLENFGQLSYVVALHDWDNPLWPTIRQAVEDFIQEHPEWYIDYNVEMVVVLRRREQ